jgi:hypothetical protein
MPWPSSSVPGRLQVKAARAVNPGSLSICKWRELAVKKRFDWKDGKRKPWPQPAYRYVGAGCVDRGKKVVGEPGRKHLATARV